MLFMVSLLEDILNIYESEAVVIFVQFFIFFF